MSLAVALLLLIQESGMSLRCIARRAGIDVAVLSRFKRGKTMPDLETCEKLLKALRATCEFKREGGK